jgi:GDPmannose 4,6-dehydratase
MLTALICGVSGQDGSYLARLLLNKGYIVYGAVRDAQVSAFNNLNRLGIIDNIRLVSVSLQDFRSVIQTLAITQPDEIYNLAGQSSVGLSFEQPVETLESITTGTLNLLEAIRFMNRPVRFYNAGSGECFGSIDGFPSNENTPFRPCSPYGVAKAAAYWQVATYRDAYNLFACTGILFNHESPLRPSRFVTRKIIAAACRIAAGSGEKLLLGNLEIERDWGWAPEYVEAMWQMLQEPTPSDFVIATSKSYKLSVFVQEAFSGVGLDWKDHVQISPDFFRPTDLMISRADPSLAERKLGWKAKKMMPEVVRMMIEVELGKAGA